MWFKPNLCSDYHEVYWSINRRKAFIDQKVACGNHGNTPSTIVSCDISSRFYMGFNIYSVIQVGKLKNLCESFFNIKSIKPKLFLQEAVCMLTTCTLHIIAIFFFFITIIVYYEACQSYSVISWISTLDNNLLILDISRTYAMNIFRGYAGRPISNSARRWYGNFAGCWSGEWINHSCGWRVMLISEPEKSF